MMYTTENTCTDSSIMQVPKLVQLVQLYKLSCTSCTDSIIIIILYSHAYIIMYVEYIYNVMRRAELPVI